MRTCGPDDVLLLRSTIDSSLEHLRAWMTWAIHEPATLTETRQRLERGAARFAKGEDFSYGIFNATESEIVGGAGLHRRGEPDCLEIGYWIRGDCVGAGFATETARALTGEGLKLPEIDRIQIDCDPENRRSLRIPEKLGYEVVELVRANKVTPDGRPRDTLVYEITSAMKLLAEPRLRPGCG